MAQQLVPVYVDSRPARLAASSKQLTPKRGQRLKILVGVPWPPRMGPGTPSNHLRGPAWCVFFRPRGAFFGLTAPNGPKGGPRAPGWALVGSGGRVLGRDPLGRRVGSLLVVVCQLLPCEWCLLGPKQPQMGPDGPGTCSTGDWWPCLGTESSWATCGWPCGHCLPIFLLQKARKGPKRPQNGPKRVPEMAKMENGPGPFGVLKDTLFGPVLTPFSNSPFWDRKGVKKRPDPCVLSNTNLDH